MKMETDELRKYAQVILKIGVNLQEGQNLLIRGEPMHWSFFVLLAEEAYSMGAKYVRVTSQHPALAKARANFSSESYLEYVPDYVSSDLKEMIDEAWAIVTIEGMEDPAAFDDIDKEKHAIIRKTHSRRVQPFFEHIVGGKCAWCIAPLPTPKWAALIYDRKATSAARKALWENLKDVLFLREDDPVARWQQESALLKERAQKLNELKLDHLLFKAPGTELKVGLTPVSKWFGGQFKGARGAHFLPNLPTFEVFSTPDYRRTSGTVRVTKPVRVLGSEVCGAWFKFLDGRVVEFGAESGRELLEHYFKIDEKSQFLGEVALVDSSSPIYKTGHLFHSILLDENAACHIALGRCIPIAVENGTGMSEKELDAAGCNTAIQHTDFMIGSDEIDVIGFNENGRFPIIEKGLFVL